MPKPEFDIVIEKNLAEVRHDVSSKSPRGRFYAGLFFIAILIASPSIFLFEPGKHNRPSMWQDILISPIDSSGFIFPICLLFLYFAVMGFVTFRYLFAAYPSDETMRCDSSTLTVSKVAWFDTSNSHWKTWSFSLNEVTEIKYGVIASAKQTSIRGLRFRAQGKTWKILPGLEAPEAVEILKALMEMGARVIYDTKLEVKAAKVLKDRAVYGPWT